MRVYKLLLFSLSFAQAFVSRGQSSKRLRFDLHSLPSDEDCNNRREKHSTKNVFSRRDACFAAVAAGGTGLIAVSSPAWANDDFHPAARPTAYRVDSTQPPTLIPLSNARKEARVLSELGQGKGTNKEAILDDRVNLNNMLNKAVFGTIDAVNNLSGPKESDTLSGEGYASFVCLGIPRTSTETDVALAIDLLSPIVQARKEANTALGLAFCPLSAQPDLDTFMNSGGEQALGAALTEKGVSEATVHLYMPLIEYAKTKKMSILAMSPELGDIKTARREGLQNVSLERREAYVVDTEGFIALSQTPKFRLYADRSLLKDFEPLANDDKPGDFFAERILVHETAATVAATYASKRPDSLVAVVAPTPDLRFLGGINGRIPRISKFLNKDSNKVTDDAVTTIILNPTAEETLSKSRFLRLEIGTGPETLDLQTKVADYLWFSSSPKVNLIPRLMNA